MPLVFSSLLGNRRGGVNLSPSSAVALTAAPPLALLHPSGPTGPMSSGATGVHTALSLVGGEHKISPALPQTVALPTHQKGKSL
jgi:hypothetical protein